MRYSRYIHTYLRPTKTVTPLSLPVVRYSHVNTVRGANVNRDEFPPRETVTDLLSTAIDRDYLTHCFAVVHAQ